MKLKILKPRQQLSSREREAVAKLHRLLNEPGLLRASFIRMKRSCGRDYCRCSRSKRYRHESWYAIQRHQGKSRMQFISKEKEEQAREWISRYKIVKELLDTVSSVYWEALRAKP